MQFVQKRLRTRDSVKERARPHFGEKGTKVASPVKTKSTLFFSLKSNEKFRKGFAKQVKTFSYHLSGTPPDQENFECLKLLRKS